MIIDAVLTPAEIALLPQADLSETMCVVFDVLRATSSMVTALAHGVPQIVPVRTIAEAWTARQRAPHALLGGERHGERIEGFHVGNSPFEYRELRGQTVISTTTNGTIALRACDGAPRVLIGAILNLAALVEEVRRSEPKSLLLVCAGTFTTFALEDAWGAGRLVQLLGEPRPSLDGTDLMPQAHELTDAAQAVLAIARSEPDPLIALRGARNGRALAAKGRAAEVEWCAQESHYRVNGELEAGVIRVLRVRGKALVARPFSA